MLLSKLNRLSLANEALYKGQGGQRPDLRGSRDDDENAGAADWRWTWQGPAWHWLRYGNFPPGFGKGTSWPLQGVMCLLLWIF
jgi:hypothetical protein